MAARRDPSLTGIFINDLHEPSAHVLEGPIQTHPDAKLVPWSSDLDAKPALGGSDPNASMMMSPADVTMLALDQTD